MSTGSNPPARRGCLFYGFLFLVLAVLGLVVLGGLGYYFARKTADRWVQEYTETTPAQLERQEYSQARLETLQNRLAAFQTVLDQGQTMEELVLTAEDLNILISRDKTWNGRVRTEITDDHMRGEISLPLTDLGPLKLQGRYLNGTAVLRVALTNGVADIRVDEVRVRGKPLPSLVMNELRKMNLAQKAQQDPKLAADLARFDSVQITNGTLVIRNRVK